MLCVYPLPICFSNNLSSFLTFTHQNPIKVNSFEYHSLFFYLKAPKTSFCKLYSILSHSFAISVVEVLLFESSKFSFEGIAFFYQFWIYIKGIFPILILIKVSIWLLLIISLYLCNSFLLFSFSYRSSAF
jgi:hypothetical protein